MADTADARAWLTANLKDPDREHRTSGDYYKVVASYIVDLPAVAAELVRVVGLRNS